MMFARSNSIASSATALSRCQNQTHMDTAEVWNITLADSMFILRKPTKITYSKPQYVWGSSITK